MKLKSYIEKEYLMRSYLTVLWLLRLFVVVAYGCLVLSTQKSEAKTFAYLIGTDGKATKIDVDTDTIISTQDLANAGSFVQSGNTCVVADPVNKHLFVVTGRKGSKVLVYDLKTLVFIKDIGIYTPEPDISIFLTPDGKKIFVVW